jgi:hypothetical protein
MKPNEPCKLFLKSNDAWVNYFDFFLVENQKEITNNYWCYDTFKFKTTTWGYNVI